MIKHPFTLHHLALELKGQLDKAVCVGCYIHEEQTLVLQLETRSGPEDLEWQLRHPFTSLFLRSSQGRPRKNTRDCFALLQNLRVKSLQHCSPDRIISIDFHSVELRFHLFGGTQANVLVLNGDGWVLDAIRNRKALVGQEYRVKGFEMKSFQDFDPTLSVAKVLSDCSLQLGQYYALHVLKELGISPDTSVSALNADVKSKVLRSAETFVRECIEQPHLQLLQDDEHNELLSLHALNTFHQQKVYDSVSDAIRWRVVHLHQKRRREDMLKAVRDAVAKDSKRLSVALEKMQHQDTSDAQEDHYRYAADLLLSQADVRLKGMNTITISGWSGERVVVSLDPTKDLRENAESYYSRARRARESKRIRLEREPRYRREWERKQKLLAEVQEDIDEQRLRELYDTLITPMKEQSDSSQAMNTIAYRHFILAPGYQAYVGKDAKNNDELTMKFARQNDLWFHARGVSGSHVILRSAQEKVPKNIIEMAAALAAYYSKARNAKYCPVVYTQRKYVRKPKGAAVGAVRLEREEVIMVEPKLSGQSAGGDQEG